MAIGVSFVPSEQGQGQGTPSAVSPLQQAIQFLSLRLPKVFGAGAMAAPETLNGPGAAGLGGDASPDAFFRRLMQQAGQGGGQPPGVPLPPGQPPTPPGTRIIPGVPTPPGTRIIPGVPTPPVPPSDVSSPYQQAASMMSPVMAGQPGSADALIEAIRRAAPPGQRPQQMMTGTPPAPQPTAPQPIPGVPAPTVPGRFPFGGGTRFGG